MSDQTAKSSLTWAQRVKLAMKRELPKSNLMRRAHRKRHGIQVLRKAFLMADTDKNGVLDANELKMVIEITTNHLILIG